MRPTTDILVFSDNKDHKNIFNSFLSIDQSTIQFAEKGEAGIFKYCSQNFDLVIVEISQPLISEIQFFEQLRSLNKLIPIVIVSEYFHDTRGVVFQEQISDFITMPLTLDKLSTAVNNALTANTKKQLGKSIDNKTLESKKLSFLYEISKILTSITDYDKLLSSILDISTDALNAERATLFVLDKSTNELWSRVGTGIERREIRFSIDSGIAGEVVSTGRIIHSENPYEHPAFNKAIDSKTGFTTRNLICVPLKNMKNEILGAFQVLNKIEKGFDSEDIFFFTAIASTVAIALENTLLHDDLKKKYDEIHRLCDELYIAQNQIVLDSKQFALAEVSNFIKGIRSRFSLSEETAKLNSMIAKDKKASKQLERISTLHEKYLDKIENFVNSLKRDLGKNKK